MEKNFTVLGPYVLPLSEQFKVARSLVCKKAAKYLFRVFKLHEVSPADDSLKCNVNIARSGALSHSSVETQAVGISTAINLKSIGGSTEMPKVSAVVDGIVRNLKLLPHHAEPSRHTLYNYGNTSSSSIWYELNYVRHYGNQRRGHRILQVAFGSGFKCNTAVWLCLQSEHV
mmetsp:Transcript_8683/g.35766  ORF Transcript_8683/g.35766 Transcript_8683/m.35766 type:complete len:172 (+) Transcript_8683:1306-1821(+)